ncbi:MAG: NADH:flavin oxidoreductase [Desulfobacterales bacterium]|nr:NADH:flavin oxidoreductase [Desulfobacterales bacterium]
MKLFEPLTINGMTVRNRIVMAPMQLRLGLGNPRARAFYLARASGGAGAIIMCGTSVDLLMDDAAWGRADGVARFVENMRGFTDEIHATGTRIGIQLWHGNLWPAGNGGPMPGAEPVAPSATAECRALTIAEIQAISAKFAAAAATAQKAGMDFVEVHGAHGYLVCQFFSGADNRRTDAYGGDLAGRMRFGVETVQAMRQAVGQDFPIFYRLGAQEHRPGGITLRQSQAFAVELQKAGVDAFDISIGATAGRSASPGPRAKPGTFVPLAERIKAAVSVPVMALGRINTPELAEAILVDGRADLVGIGRQLIADPFWPDKVHAGRSETITACLSCNRCFQPLRNPDWSWKSDQPLCKVNPKAGREMEG